MTSRQIIHLNIQIDKHEYLLRTAQDFGARMRHNKILDYLKKELERLKLKNDTPENNAS